MSQFANHQKCLERGERSELKEFTISLRRERRVVEVGEITVLAVDQDLAEKTALQKARKRGGKVNWMTIRTSKKGDSVVTVIR